MYNAFFMDLPVSSFVSYSSLLSLLTAKSVDLVVAHDGFPLKLKLSVCFIYVYSGYFDCRGSFRTVFDSYCCVTG